VEKHKNNIDITIKMKPYNDFRNPYIYLISFISLIPSVIIFFLFGLKATSVTQIQIQTVITITPIAVVYFILWNLYKKSADYKKRYG